MSQPALAHHFFTMACNNAWANQRLLRAVEQLPQDEFAATRVSFFPSLKATLNHNLTVDWLYVDALERTFGGQPPHQSPGEFFDPEVPFAECSGLAHAQREVDLRLVTVCRELDEAGLLRSVLIKRQMGIVGESATRLLAHVFQHQIHHRGQAHAMLAGTSVAPPPLDEFFCANEAEGRSAELVELGLSESEVWK